MTAFRELSLTYTDGTSAVVQTERDDARGRTELDRQARLELCRSKVTSAHVSAPVTRRAMTSTRRSYR